MKIILRGDITDIESGIIVHQVNLRGSMGAGIALAIANKYPTVKSRYLSWYKQAKLGDVQFVEIDEKLIICNLAGQLDYGPNKVQTDYEAYEKAIPTIKKYSTERRLKVYIPYLIGAGLAAGDKIIIHKIIKKHKLNPIFVVYK